MALFKWLIYWQQTSGVSVSQNLSIPNLSCSKFLGLYVFLMHCFNDPHANLMRLRSGDLGGFVHQ